MKKISRRDRLKIYGDVLSALSNESANDKVVLTRVQVQVNVPFDRLKNYVSELTDLGLVQNDTSHRLTEKGRQFLREYGKVLEFMKRMGLTY